MPELKIIATLLPCPFCGGEACMTKLKADAAGTRYVYRVSCTDWSSEKCSCSPISKWYDTKEEAEEGWNTRTVKRGEWLCVGHDDKSYWYRCSVCGYEEHENITKHDNYCPNCGADMRTE